MPRERLRTDTEQAFDVSLGSTGTGLRRVRLNADLTPTELSGLAYITPSHVSLVEAHKRSPSFATVEAWANACGYRVALTFLRDPSLDAVEVSDAR